jgi:hypothetical protein
MLPARTGGGKVAETEVDVKKLMDDLVKEIDELERRVRAGGVALLLKLLEELEAVHNASEQLKGQLADSEAPADDTTQQFEEIRHRLDCLRASLSVSLTPQLKAAGAPAESENNDGGKEEKDARPKKLEWWELLLFFIAWVAVGLASNALANVVPVNSLPLFLLAAAVLVGGVGVLHHYGAGALSNFLLKQPPAEESEK